MTRAVLQRRCACGGTPGPDGECAACKAKRLALQRRSRGEAATSAPPLVSDVLHSPGRPLEDGTRGFMEGRFGHDFSRVRVHDDARAADSARAVNARAYTVGNAVVFGAGEYAPRTRAGSRVLAHELTHVLQQRGLPGGGGTPHVRPAADAWEREGEDIARRVMDGGLARTPVRVRRLDEGAVQRLTYGTGTGPDFGGGDHLVPVPEAHRDRVEAAVGIISRIVSNPRDYPECPRFFEKNCPGGSKTSLVDSFNKAVLWFNEGAPWNRGGVTDATFNIGYTALIYRIGRWAMAASLFHELMHVCGQNDHDIGDQAKNACGRLPDIIAISPRIEISNPIRR